MIVQGLQTEPFPWEVLISSGENSAFAHLMQL